MKIRISDQSLRVRLSKEEAIQLHAGSTITTELRLNTIDVFAIELRSWNLTIAEIHFEDNHMLISIPMEAAQQIAITPGYTYLFDAFGDAKDAMNLAVEIDFEKAPHT
jgi:hypothetical protein